MRARGRRTRPGTSGRLLERERELEALAAAVEDVADGNAGLVLVEGPAGIGKSRLLAAARTLADERGLGVLAARGGELERDFPFGIVRQLFESALSDESARSNLLAGVGLPARRNVAPSAASKIVADGPTGKVLGVHVLAENAGDVILAGVYAIKLGMRVEELADTGLRT